MAENFLRTNNVVVIGRLVEVNVKKDFDKSGKSYISVDTTVQSEINGKTNIFEINFYAREMTKDNKVSKLYTSYERLEELKGKKIQIDGELTENRFWSTNLGQLVSGQKIAGKYVKGVIETTSDIATFEIGGFVVKELVDKTNKANEIYRHDIVIGQANYNGTSMNAFTLHIDPSDRVVVNGVRSYEVGMTVQVKGNLVFTEEQVTVVDENSGFGEEMSRVYTNKQKNFFISGGSKPIVDESKYQMDMIRGLTESYKTKGVELMQASASKEEETPVQNASQITKRQNSLI